MFSPGYPRMNRALPAQLARRAHVSKPSWRSLNAEAIQKFFRRCTHTNALFLVADRDFVCSGSNDGDTASYPTSDTHGNH